MVFTQTGFLAVVLARRGNAAGGDPIDTTTARYSIRRGERHPERSPNHPFCYCPNGSRTRAVSPPLPGCQPETHLTTTFNCISRSIPLLAEQRFHQLLPRDVQVFSHIPEDRTQCADPKRSVPSSAASSSPPRSRGSLTRVQPPRERRASGSGPVDPPRQRLPLPSLCLLQALDQSSIFGSACGDYIILAVRRQALSNFERTPACKSGTALAGDSKLRHTATSTALRTRESSRARRQR
jgi:hypothetical protein